MRKRARENLAEGKVLLGIPSGSKPKPARQEAEAESSTTATQGKSKMREEEKQIRKLQLEKRENLAQIEKLKETIAHKEIVRRLPTELTGRKLGFIMSLSTLSRTYTLVRFAWNSW